MTVVPALDVQLDICDPQAGGDDRGSVAFWRLVLGHLAEAGLVVSGVVESVLHILEASQPALVVMSQHLPRSTLEV